MDFQSRLKFHVKLTSYNLRLLWRGITCRMSPYGHHKFLINLKTDDVLNHCPSILIHNEFIEVFGTTLSKNFVNMIKSY